MNPLRHRSTIRHGAAGLVAGLLLTGCSSWRPMAGSPDATLIPPRERSVRVELNDGERFELLHPELVADTLLVGTRVVGRFDPDAPALGSGQPRRIPTARLIGIETRQQDPAKTALLSAVVVAGVLFAYFSFVHALVNAVEESVWPTLQEGLPERDAPPSPARAPGPGGP